MLLDDDIWSNLTQGTRSGISAKAVGETLEQAPRALEAGTFDSRLDRVIVNHKPSLDEKGWDRAVAILREAHEQIDELEADAVARTPDSSRRARFTISLLGYEFPKGTTVQVNAYSSLLGRSRSS